MAPTMETPGILHFRFPAARSITQPVQIIGIQPEERAKTGDFGEFLFDDQQASRSPRRSRSPTSSSEHTPAGEILKELQDDPDDDRQDDAGSSSSSRCDEQAPDEGTILGYALATHHRGRVSADHLHRAAGHQGRPALPQAGKSRSEAGFDTFTVVGYFKSGMSEYDSTHVYVPLERLAGPAAPARRQRPRGGQPDPDQGQARRRPRRAGREDPGRPRRAPARRSSASTPGSRSKGRSWGPSPSSRAS